MASHDLHPLARELIELFATESYFSPVRLASALAEKNSTQCVRWAFNLIEDFVAASTPGEDVSKTLLEIRHALSSLSVDDLSRLDELSWRSWCSSSFDESSPFAQRAIARLGWAAMLLIIHKTNSRFESRYVGICDSANAHGTVREMADQCAMALDMIYTGTNDGRLMVVVSFSREMEDGS